MFFAQTRKRIQIDMSSHCKRSNFCPQFMVALHKSGRGHSNSSRMGPTLHVSVSKLIELMINDIFLDGNGYGPRPGGKKWCTANKDRLHSLSAAHNAVPSNQTPAPMPRVPPEPYRGRHVIAVKSIGRYDPGVGLSNAAVPCERFLHAAAANPRSTTATVHLVPPPINKYLLL